MNNATTPDSLRSLLTNMQTDVILANVQTVNRDWRRERYVHNFNRMYFILDGEGEIEVDGAVYRPAPGQLVVMPCNVRQSYGTISDNVFRKYWCHFTARIGSRDLFEQYRFPVCVDLAEKERAQTEESFRRLIEAMSSPAIGSFLNVRAAMLQLIALFVDAGFRRMNVPSAATRRMSLALRYIDDHLEEKITVEQLASLLHYHPNYFIRAFRSVLGCSPIQYINRLRLDKARQLLATDTPIGDIARAVGIEQHNFSSMFKSYTGFAPRDFRRMLK
ncbi:MAG: helix-turn-helix transcriptional regulator [Paenibacillaceae bacterium]|nr:helix-turn-helix transcriptional regulator [Paenibacillaceae bacterium]